MATGWTQIELDQLFALMEDATPPQPTTLDKIEAAAVTALRIALTDRGVLVNIKTRGGGTSLYCLNCWVAKALAGEISVPLVKFNWAKNGYRPGPGDDARDPELSDLLDASQVISLATYSECEGVIVRFAVGETAKPQTFYFPASLAMEIMCAIGQGGTIAGWWTDDMSEFLPSRQGQN